MKIIPKCILPEHSNTDRLRFSIEYLDEECSDTVTEISVRIYNWREIIKIAENEISKLEEKAKNLFGT